MERKIYIVFAALFIIFSVIKCNSQTLHIKPLISLTEIDTTYVNGTKSINRIDYFIIENFTDSSDVKKEIDAYIKANYPQTFFNKYTNYSMKFYKESKVANAKNIESYPQNLQYKALKDEPTLFIYMWRNGNFLIILDN